MAFLYDEQKEAVQKMKNGCILCGGVGSGKSRTSLAYYVIQNGGSFEPFKPMKPNAKNLYIITTARKRDTLEWEGELLPFGLDKDPEKSLNKVQIVIDSWNNISKYKNVEDAFFIFDEQRVVGKGAWVKSFLRIAEYNEWVLLSATPGDKWDDYIPVFIANGFYKNRTEFNQQHCVFARFSKYPKIERWLNVGRLIRLRNSILIDIEIVRPTIRHDEDVYVDYNRIIYKDMMKNRWDIWKNEPFQTAAELCYALRKVVNSDDSRLVATMELFEKHPRMIIFYNFDYELELLKSQYYGEDVEVAEWNGHKHQPIPECDSWVYLVQYTAGAEGWNCIKTDTIVFYSQNYSYKIMEQAAGRIDRLNTGYKDLYYYHLKSRASIDLAINRALVSKKKFNEGAWSRKNKAIYIPAKQAA